VIIWHKLILLAVVLMFSTPVFADKIVVLQGSYKLTWDNEDSPQRSKIVADRVAKAVKDIGQFEVVQINKECSDNACFKKAASEHKADEAIVVHVEQNIAQYEFKIFFSNGGSFTGDATGALSVALDEIEKLTKKALKKEFKTEKLPATEIAETSADLQPTEELQEERNDRSPKAFWISLSVTGALALSWGIVEGIGYSKLKTLSDKKVDERTQSEKDKVKSLRIADRALLISTAAMVATTTVLFFLTDFDNKKSKKVSVTPVFTHEGGALMLQGNF